MTRYTVLAIMSTISTLLFVIWMCFMIGITDPTMTEIANLLNVFDMFIDLIVMTLAFSFADNAYYKLCYFCDKFLSNKCLKVTSKQTDISLSEMTRPSIIPIDKDESTVQPKLHIVKSLSSGFTLSNTTTNTNTNDKDESTVNTNSANSDTPHHVINTSVPSN